MTTLVEKKFVVDITYNGVTKPFQVEPEERVTTLLQKAIAAFGVTQNQHLLSLFRQDGTVVPENETIERADLKPHEILLLRPNAVKGGTGRLRLTRDVVCKTFRILQDCGRGKCECAVYWARPHRGRSCGSDRASDPQAISLRLRNPRQLAHRTVEAPRGIAPERKNSAPHTSRRGVSLVDGRSLANCVAGGISFHSHTQFCDWGTVLWITLGLDDSKRTVHGDISNLRRRPSLSHEHT